MTQIKSLTLFLEENPSARERKNKDLAISHILIQKHHLDIQREKLSEILHEYNSLDRYWRMILDDRKDLRGSDYEDKVELEQSKLSELGY